jgi:antitoxin ParD1/3/4
MTRLTISLPDVMGEYVTSQVSIGQYGNTSEYIRDLIRHDQEKKKMALAELRALLQEGEDSGVTDYSMDEIKGRARKKLGL